MTESEKQKVDADIKAWAESNGSESAKSGETYKPDISAGKLTTRQIDEDIDAWARQYSKK